MKICVTGGAGFIGSHVVDAYVAAGHEVHVLDNLSSGKRENINRAAVFHECDIRTREAVGIVEKISPDVLNHHAAQISVPASVKDPSLDADINIMGFLNVMEALVRSGVKRVLFASTGGAIYGEAAEYPTSELETRKPVSPYAITKSATEDYLGFYMRHYGISCAILRYANVYGPRQIPHGEAGVAAIFTDNLIAGKGSMLYSYPDEPRGMVRDYCYVGDVARANLLALGSDFSGVVNIGTGVPTRTGDLYDAVYRAVKARIKGLDENLAVPQAMGVRAGDIKRSCLKIDKAGKTFGWKPLVGLDEGISRTIEWRIASGKKNT